MTENEKRRFVVNYAKCWIGKYYKWGGAGPDSFDCSGLAIECLKAVGILQRGGDWRARDLFRKFREINRVQVQAGDLVYWKSYNAIVHVEICLDEFLAVGASGGGSKTLTPADAIRDNAFIKIRPINSRPGPVLFTDPYKNPYYPLIHSI